MADWIWMLFEAVSGVSRRMEIGQGEGANLGMCSIPL